MYVLVYISTAVEFLSQAQLIALLEQSRRDNLATDITGMLLYKDRSFMQLLEGPKEAVLALMVKIKADARHRDIIVLIEEEQPRRKFADWSMGFKRLEASTALEVPGYTDFLNFPLNSPQFHEQPEKCLKLLYLFRRVMR